MRALIVFPSIAVLVTNAYAQERLPDSIRNDIESGRHSIEDYLEVFSDCSVVYELAALTHAGEESDKEAMESELLLRLFAEETQSGLFYLLWATEQQAEKAQALLVASRQGIYTLLQNDDAAARSTLDSRVTRCMMDPAIHDVVEMVRRLFVQQSTP
jgi:hypothetical protein